MEAISHSGTAVGLLAGENAAVLAAEKRITSKLLDATRSSERLYQVDDHVGVAVAGITADANILINALRLSAQRYTFRYQEPMPIEQLVQDICDHKQGYTQFGGLRPFGVSFLFAGWCVAHAPCGAKPAAHTAYLLLLSCCTNATVKRPCAHDEDSSCRIVICENVRRVVFDAVDVFPKAKQKHTRNF